MATRPVFSPECEGKILVREQSFDFQWASGFAESQKKKNIESLHRAAKSHGIGEILEISSKSSEEIGRRLSAFSLKIEINGNKYPLESVYQGSKKFELGGPHVQLFSCPPREAKRFVREGDWGNLTGFQLLEKNYPLSPKNAFYDWLYIRSLVSHSEWIRENIGHYDAFTDIEFNPQKQINCQARAFAEYLSLLRRNILNQSAEDFDFFLDTLQPFQI